MSTINSVSGCILSVSRCMSSVDRVSIRMGCVSGCMLSGRQGVYRKGSIIVADMLYVADGYLREGSLDSIYIPLQDCYNYLVISDLIEHNVISWHMRIIIGSFAILFPSIVCTH